MPIDGGSSLCPFLEIENDFKLKLQEYVARLDADKAGLLAQLEKELNVRQDLILESARKRIDDLNEEANRLKMVNSTTARSFFFTNAFSRLSGCPQRGSSSKQRSSQ